jgi:hypothetical protein
MKLVKIIKYANKYYDDGILTLNGFYNKRSGKPLDNNDDLLARFIITEMFETHDKNRSDEEQLEEVCRVLRHGIDDLENAIRGIEELWHER